MRKEMKRDLLSFIPALRAFAFCLAQDQSCADELVHSSLIEIWSTHADKKGVALKVGAFNTLRRQFLRQLTVDPMRRQAFASQRIRVGDYAFKACFEQLPRTEREALSLIEVWRFNPSQAAEICDCDRETIVRRLGMARGHLTGGFRQRSRERRSTPTTPQIDRDAWRSPAM
jgi:RNA polymerase sigma-70 factor (ECF subfamily)